MEGPSPWNADIYRRFERERAQPFHDLVAGLDPVDDARVVDLGCGTAELTCVLHEKIGARSTLGIDSSATMLSEARPIPGVDVQEQDIRSFDPPEPFDVVFSNDALLAELPDERPFFFTFPRILIWAQRPR